MVVGVSADGLGFWWILGQVFGLAATVPQLLVGLYHFRLPKERRKESRSRKALIGLTVFVASMLVLYIFASRPWYETRSQLQDDIEIVADLASQPLIGDNNYGLISVNARRPQRGPLCFPSDVLEGSASVFFEDPVGDELLLAVADTFRRDGFEVFLLESDESISDGRPRFRLVIAIGDGRSHEFLVNLSTDERQMSVDLGANGFCDADDVQARPFTNVVETFE